MAYATSDAHGVFLVRVPAGVGKSRGLVEAVQELARQGKRTLWAAQDHSAWNDITAFEAFDPDLWMHWFGLAKVDDVGVPMCRYFNAMDTWLNRGYRSRDLCNRLCLKDGWCAEECPYHRQAENAAPIVFGQHAHITFGLPTKKFDFAVVDELPLKAFVRERIIPWRTGVAPVAYGRHDDPTTAALFKAIIAASFATQGGNVAGRQLLDILGPYLGDVYAAIETGFWKHPVIPQVAQSSDAFAADYNFLGDLLSALTMEYEAWRAGWTDWARRVWLTPTALHILSRHSLWDDLPLRVAVLDATAQPSLYGMMFNTLVEGDDGIQRWEARGIADVYAPRVERQGRFYQVTGRMYSKRSLYKVTGSQTIRHEDGKEEKHEIISTLPGLSEIARVIALLARENGANTVGVITYQKIEEPLVEELRGLRIDARSRHFYNTRGTNVMRDVGLVAVVGSPTPKTLDIIKQATALDADRQRPFVTVGDDGKPAPLYMSRVEEFRLTPAALADLQTRPGFTDAAGVGRVVGVYTDAALRAIHDQTRAAEILQAAHRGRVNIQDIPVYIFTCTPMLDEPLDGIYDDPPVGPDGIPWKTWARLEPWLDSLETGAIVGDAEIAEVLQLSAGHVRNNHWIESIVEYYARLGVSEDRRWQWPKTVMVKGRGRPRKVMVKNVNLSDK